MGAMGNLTVESVVGGTRIGVDAQFGFTPLEGGPES